MTINPPSLDINADIAAIKADIEAATRHRIRAEQARDHAQAQAEVLLHQLKADFGVADLTEANALIETLNQQLADHVADLREQLGKAR